MSTASFEEQVAGSNPPSKREPRGVSIDGEHLAIVGIREEAVLAQPPRQELDRRRRSDRNRKSVPPHSVASPRTSSDLFEQPAIDEIVQLAIRARYRRRGTEGNSRHEQLDQGSR